MWAAGIRVGGLIRALTTAPVATLPDGSGIVREWQFVAHNRLGMHGWITHAA